MTAAQRAGRIIGVVIIVQMVGGFLVNFVLEAPLFGTPGFLVNAAPHAPRRRGSLLGAIAAAAKLGDAASVEQWRAQLSSSSPES